MISLEKLVDQYCEGWSASSPDGRERLIRLALSEGATYCDPRTEQLSIPQLLGHIAKIHQSRPGAKVLRTSNVDVHHGLGRFNWQVVLPDGTTLPEGVDFIELSTDETRITRIIGFFGPLTGAPELLKG